MKLVNFLLSCFFLLFSSSLVSEDKLIQHGEEKKTYLEDEFIATRQQLKRYYDDKKVVMIASPGRSGSTLLTDVVKRYATDYAVLKTHILPPSAKFKGKILFIFSNPDKAAESVLHRLVLSKTGGKTHFFHVESADQKWFERIGENARNQSNENNLLAYDALGCEVQLEQWLYKKVSPSTIKEAQVLAVKYEHLWDQETVDAIKEFLELKVFKLPPKEERGCGAADLTSMEIRFKKIYNEGMESQPRYAAYDRARDLWRNAPSLQFFKLAK